MCPDLPAGSGRDGLDRMHRMCAFFEGLFLYLVKREEFSCVGNMLDWRSIFSFWESLFFFPIHRPSCLPPPQVAAQSQTEYIHLGSLEFLFGSAEQIPRGRLEGTFLLELYM